MVAGLCRMPGHSAASIIAGVLHKPDSAVGNRLGCIGEKSLVPMRTRTTLSSRTVFSLTKRELLAKQCLVYAAGKLVFENQWWSTLWGRNGE